MTTEKTTSWIFLAIAMGSSAEPISFAGISSIADGINHAVPNHKELQTAIKWLTGKRLIAKSKNRYSLTISGELVYKNASTNVNRVLMIWSNLEDDFKAYGAELT